MRVESEHVFASSLQTFYHHDTHPLQKLVAQRVVLLAVFPENCAIEKDSCGRFDRACGELPQCMAGTSTTSPTNHRGRSCRLSPGCRLARSIRELLFRFRLNKIGWPFRLRGKLSALFRSEQMSRNQSAAPPVHDSFRPETDEATTRVLSGSVCISECGFYLRIHNCSFLTWLNKVVFFFADDAYWTSNT